jgi:undecaprenyl-diphosphatase
VSLVLLMRWFRSHEFNALKPFAYYCAIAGLASLALMLVIP